MKNRYYFVVLFCLAAALAATGCGKKNTPPEEDKLVARINDYDLTVNDFRGEAKAAFANQYIGGDPEKAKDDLLYEVITKKVLLKQAQAQNFDKDREFMKEIERYWEQALLKLLIKKKTLEFLESTTVSEAEVEKEYRDMQAEEPEGLAPLDEMAPSIISDIRRKKVQKAFDVWMAECMKKADVKIYKENLKYINVK